MIRLLDQSAPCVLSVSIYVTRNPNRIGTSQPKRVIYIYNIIYNIFLTPYCLPGSYLKTMVSKHEWCFSDEACLVG